MSTITRGGPQVRVPDHGRHAVVFGTEAFFAVAATYGAAGAGFDWWGLQGSLNAVLALGAVALVLAAAAVLEALEHRYAARSTVFAGALLLFAAIGQAAFDAPSGAALLVAVAGVVLVALRGEEAVGR